MFIFGSYVLPQYLSVLSQSTYIQRSHFSGKTVIIKKGSLPQNSWWPCSQQEALKIKFQYVFRGLTASR